MKFNFDYHKLSDKTFYLILCSLISIAMVLYSLKYQLYAHTDYIGYLNGASIIVQNQGQNLYDSKFQLHQLQNLIHKYRTMDILLPFRAPAVTALIYTPFTIFDLKIGYLIFIVLSIFLMPLSFYIFKNDITDFKTNLLMFFCNLNILLVLIKHTQPNVILIPLFFLIYIALLKKVNSTSIGILTGIFFLKPHFLLVAPFIMLFTTNKFKFIKGLVFSTGVFFILSVVITKGAFLTTYAPFVFYTESEHYFSNPAKMFSIQSLLAAIPLSGIYFKTIIQLTTIIIYAMLFLAVKTKLKNNANNWELLYALSIFVLPIFFHHTWAQEIATSSITLIILNKLRHNKIITEEKFNFFMFYILLVTQGIKLIYPPIYALTTVALIYMELAELKELPSKNNK